MNRPVLVVLALSVLAAGCLGQEEPTTPNADPGPAPGPRFAFSQPLGVDDSRAAAEPSIRVAADGTIWITAPFGLGGGDGVWRSMDQGASFEYMGTPDPVFGGGDSDLAIDADGRLYQSGLWLGCVSVATSTDGSDWTMNPLACREPVDDRQWLDTHGAGTLYVTFGGGVSGNGAPAIQVLKSVMVDPAPIMVTTSLLPDSSDYQWPGNLAVDETTGNVYVAYLTVDDRAFVYKSADGGDSWEKIPVSERPGDTFDSFVVVATDRAGNVYLTWSERESDKLHTSIYVTVSQDQGATWREPIKVNTIETTVFPWIVAGDAGRIDLAYYGTNATGESPEKVDGLWHVYLAQSLDMLAETPTFTEVRVSDAAVKDGSVCTSGTGCAEGTRGLLDYFQVDIDPLGYAHIAYTENLEDPGIVMYAKQTEGSSLLLNGTAANGTEAAADLALPIPSARASHASPFAWIAERLR